jgi:hypothetical protein
MPADLKSAFTALVSEPPLSAATCLSINAKLGALMLLSGVAVFAFSIADPSPPLPPWMAAPQITLGAAFLGGWAATRRKPESQTAMARLHGILWVVAVALYVVLMVVVIPNRHHKHMGVAHVPGLLAAAAAYSVRQIMDFSSARSWSRIRLATWLALVCGGACDLLLVWMMIHSFLNFGQG